MLTLSISQNCSFFKYCKPEKLYSTLCNNRKEMEHSFQIVRKDLPIFFPFFFSDGRNIIGLHIAVAAACSVGIFGRRKLIHLCIFVATIFDFTIKEDWETPHFLLCFGVSTWHFREQKPLPAQRKLLHCRLVYTVYI